jgi:tetratricopeptide (TPR) repeat protein
MRLLQGQPAEGIEDARRSVAAKEKVGGANNPDIAHSLNSVSQLLLACGEVDEALREIERALVIGEVGFGPQHPSTGTFLSNYAELLNAVGRFDEALTPARRALALFETETDADDLTAAFPMTALAVACLELGRLEEALPLLERAAAIREKDGGKAVQRGEVHVALARALRAAQRQPVRAQALAVLARSEYAQAVPGRIVARELAKIDAWLG